MILPFFSLKMGLTCSIDKTFCCLQRIQQLLFPGKEFLENIFKCIYLIYMYTYKCISWVTAPTLSYDTFKYK